MSIFSDLKEGLKIIKAIKEIKEFLNSTHITKEIKEDIETIKKAVERLGKKFAAFITLSDIIKKYMKKQENE